MLIRIRKLQAQALIGVHPRERVQKQVLAIDLELEYDARTAAAEDRFSEAVDYAAIGDAVVELVESSRFRLIETLAERVAERVMADPRVSAVRVEVVKPGALRYAESVAAVCRRERRA